MKILAAILGLALIGPPMSGPLAAGQLPRPYLVEHYDVHLTPDLANAWPAK
jgi:hypothetical protein